MVTTSYGRNTSVKATTRSLLDRETDARCWAQTHYVALMSTGFLLSTPPFPIAAGAV